MAQLNNLNRFQYNPVNIDRPRCKIGREYTTNLTFNSGVLVPFYVHEVLPGETTKLNLSNVLRSATPSVPVMDTAFVDYFFFFVPSRLCTYQTDDWQKVMGENKSNYWAPSTETDLVNSGNTVNIKDLTSTTVNSISYKVAPQSLLNYLGCPVLPATRVGTGSGNTTGVINTLAARAYYKIWNEWFRDENTQAPVDFDSKKNYLGAADFDTNTAMLSVNKYHDLFTSVLPGPLKSNTNVALPLGTVAPVITSETDSMSWSSGVKPALHLKTIGGLEINPSASSSATGINLAVQKDTHTSNKSHLAVGNIQSDSYPFTESTDADGTTPYSGDDGTLLPVNLWTDLSAATGATINELRNAFAIQRLFERDARSGTRYFEYLLGAFGVSNPDLVLQRPEYLAGKRVPLNITQVVQTNYNSASPTTNPLGSTGAFSNTASSDYMFTKSFGEYGYILGLCCVRTSQSYSQGLPKYMLRTRRFDFFDPVFSNLGETPIKKKELFFGNSSSDNEAVFGYQEAWADYRYHFNQVLGFFNPDTGNALAQWTYTNKFTSYPTLNSDFMKQNKGNYDQTLAATGGNFQFIGQSYFQEELSLPMPVYSIPGLIDHH